MKNVLTFNDFINEAYITEKIQVNPSDMTPVKSGEDFATFNDDSNHEAGDNFEKYKYRLVYHDKNKQIPLSYLKTDASYKAYLEKKFYQTKPMEEVWPLVSKTFGGDVPSKMPGRNGIYSYDVDGGDIIVGLHVDKFGRGEASGAKNMLYFSVRDNKDAKKNIAMIKKFIKANCFLPNAEPIEQPK